MWNITPKLYVNIVNSSQILILRIGIMILALCPWLPGQQNTLNKMIIFLNMELLIPTECVRINCDQ